MIKLLKSKAFTLAEIIVVFTIIGVVATAIIKPMRNTATSHTNKLMFYSAFTNMQLAVSRMLSDGCTAADAAATPAICAVAGQSNIPKLQTAAAARGFCDRLSDLFNVVGTATCSNVISSTASGSFTTASQVFNVTNGMRFFIQPSINGDATAGYTVYVDIDGSQRDGEYQDDVLPIYVYLDGTVLPGPGPDLDTQYLSATIRTTDSSTTPNKTGILKDGTTLYSAVPYRQAICVAGGTSETGYCTGYTKSALCTGTLSCQAVINKPGMMFFSR